MAQRRNQDQLQNKKQDSVDFYQYRTFTERADDLNEAGPGAYRGATMEPPQSGIIDEGRLYRDPDQHFRQSQSYSYNQMQRFENEAAVSDVDPRYQGGASYYNHPRDVSDYRTNQGIMGQTEDFERNFFGKGPKGYKRADERIFEDVCEVLYRDPRIDASEIEVSVKDGLVTLSGSVENRAIKRLAEDVVEHRPGVIDVANRLRFGSNQAHAVPALEELAPTRNLKQKQKKSKKTKRH